MHNFKNSFFTISPLASSITDLNLENLLLTTAFSFISCILSASYYLSQQLRYAQRLLVLRRMIRLHNCARCAVEVVEHVNSRRVTERARDRNREPHYAHEEVSDPTSVVPRLVQCSTNIRNAALRESILLQNRKRRKPGDQLQRLEPLLKSIERASEVEKFVLKRHYRALDHRFVYVADVVEVQLLDFPVDRDNQVALGLLRKKRAPMEQSNSGVEES